MRGKGQFLIVGVCAVGITPAYAGKSGACITPAKITKDHPRLCGEKYQIGAFFASPLGSPPPMRGKVHNHLNTVYYTRITPAYAGKSLG